MELLAEQEEDARASGGDQAVFQLRGKHVAVETAPSGVTAQLVVAGINGMAWNRTPVAPAVARSTALFSSPVLA